MVSIELNCLQIVKVNRNIHFSLFLSRRFLLLKPVKEQFPQLLSSLSEKKLFVISIVVLASLSIVSTSSTTSLPISSSAVSLSSRSHFFFSYPKPRLPCVSHPSSFLDLFDPRMAFYLRRQGRSTRSPSNAQSHNRK